MVSGELKIKALGQCLAYRRMRQDTSEDPFRADVAVGEAETDSALGSKAEHLLWYLSSLGGGRWSAFSVACTALEVGDLARRLARSLRLLGHLEVSSDGERWSVTPPTCLRVRQPDGTALRFWAGARTAATTGERSLQQGGPSRLLAGETAREELVNPAERLAPLLPTLEEYRASLGVVGGVSAVQHKFAKFDGLAFKPVTFEGEPGLYEVTGREGRTLTLLYSQGQWLKGDWYGLRYLTLQASGLLLSARYDAERWSLALPADQRPPELFERALVLCSGLLPSRRERWLTYQNVPPSVAQEVAERRHRIRIGREAGLGPEAVERRADKREEPGAPGANLDGGVGEAEPLGRDQAGEIGQLAHDQVRPPPAAEFQDVGEGPPCTRAREDVDPDCGSLRRLLRGALRFRRGVLDPVVDAGREAAEPVPGDRRAGDGGGREGNLVPGGLQRRREREQRVPVPGAGLGREQGSHGRLLLCRRIGDGTGAGV
jgi:hypothetical protein